MIKSSFIKNTTGSGALLSFTTAIALLFILSLVSCQKKTSIPQHLSNATVEIVYSDSTISRFSLATDGLKTEYQDETTSLKITLNSTDIGSEISLKASCLKQKPIQIIDVVFEYNDELKGDELVFYDNSFNGNAWTGIRKHNGKKIIEEGGQPDLWRAGTDNDRMPFLFENVFGPQSNKIRSLENASPYCLATIELEKPVINIEKDNGKIVIKTKWELKENVGNCEINYTIHPDGTVACNVAYDLKQLKDKRKPLPLRIGKAWKLSAGFDQLKWYGRGPDETYPGRDFEALGIFQGSVDEQWTDYNRPQENGAKSGTRWFTLSNSKGVGVKVITSDNQALSLNVSHYSREEMKQARYTYQMKRSDEVYLNIDHQQMGVEGMNSWGKCPLEKYADYRDIQV